MIALDAGRASGMLLEAGELVCFEGFAWAVPMAFAPAVGAYRFEQGDVLHRTRAGYAPLEGRVGSGLMAIQIRQPPRSARVLPGEFEGDRRLANWQSELELELVEFDSGRSELFTTTQGRLLMTLWQGELDWLDPAHVEPPLPRSARELAQFLREGGGAPTASRSAARPEGVRFVFVVDLSSDVSRAKATAVEDALQAIGKLERADRRPEQLGHTGSPPFHPTLVVRELAIRNATAEAAEAALKRVLYAGAGEAERFQIGRHGLLEPLGGADGRG